MKKSTTRAMEGVYPMPIEGREDPPRSRGLTMVIDMGNGVGATKDLLELADRYIDIIKISSGSIALYEETVLRKKIEIIKNKGIKIEAGGSHFEVAFWKKCISAYFGRLKKLNFDLVEIADGHITVPLEDRLDAIKRVKDMGLKVVTEVGKKLPRENIKATGILEQTTLDLDAGADYVIIEGKASGINVGIYDQEGSIDELELKVIVNGLADLSRLIWEAPLREQQQGLILKFGINVNLGNVFAHDVYPLELMRNGLMLMPLIKAYEKESSKEMKQ